MGQPAQLAVDERRQPLQCLMIAAAPRSEELRQFPGAGRIHRIAHDRLDADSSFIRISDRGAKPPNKEGSFDRFRRESSFLSAWQSLDA
jgi:hypothetical protein